MSAQLNRGTLISARGADTDNMHTKVYERFRANGQRHRDTEMIASADLLRWLGGSSESVCTEIDKSNDILVATRLDLAPGDALYAQGSVSHYVYVVESGLLQCHSQHDGQGLPISVSYAGAREWIGLYDHLGRRKESVNAATYASLLALPVGELRALSASSQLLAELLARRTSTALKRDWRVAYSLRDLPPYTRTVVGLVHLVRLINPNMEKNQFEACVSVVLNVAIFGNWLGLPASDLHQSLTQLQRYGALCFDARHITELTPQVLFSASSAMSYLTNGKYVPEPMFMEWDLADSECVWEDSL